jgi:hypothetical protein
MPIMTETAALELIVRTLRLESTEEIVPELTKLAADEYTHPAITNDLAENALTYLELGNRFTGDARADNFRLAAAEVVEMARYM